MPGVPVGENLAPAGGEEAHGLMGTARHVAWLAHAILCSALQMVDTSAGQHRQLDIDTAVFTLQVWAATGSCLTHWPGCWVDAASRQLGVGHLPSQAPYLPCCMMGACRMTHA